MVKFKIIGILAATVGLLLGLTGPAQADPPVPMVKLINHGTGFCATAMSAGWDYAISMQPCRTGDTAQGWKIYRRYDPNIYELRNDRDGRCLGAYEGSMEEGALLATEDCVFTRSSQMWKTEIMWPGARPYHNVKSSRCMAHTGGTWATQTSTNCVYDPSDHRLQWRLQS
jgi:hypothetical protein